MRLVLIQCAGRKELAHERSDAVAIVYSSESTLSTQRCNTLT